MKRMLGVLLCATTLGGCATSYTVQPLADQSETIRYNRGEATTYFDSKEVAVQVTSTGFNTQGQITFGVAVVNKSDHAINFGYDNIRLADQAGKPIAIYDRATLERQVRNRAMIAAAVVGVAGGLAAASAANSGYSTSSGTLYTPRGAYSYQSQTYEPALAYATTAAVTAATGAGIVSIQQQLGQTIATLNGRILATTTIDPGQSYGGVIVGDRLKGAYPQVVSLKVAEGGAEHEFRFNIAQTQ